MVFNLKDNKKNKEVRELLALEPVSMSINRGTIQGGPKKK